MSTASAIPGEITDTRKLFLALLSDLAEDMNYQQKFKGASRELHAFFWKISRDASYSGFVDELLFDSNGNYPQCEQIDELLQEFQLAGVLTRPNPTYRYHDISLTNHPFAREFKDKLREEERDKYRVIMENFKRELGVPTK